MLHAAVALLKVLFRVSEHRDHQKWTLVVADARGEWSFDVRHMWCVQRWTSGTNYGEIHYELMRSPDARWTMRQTDAVPLHNTSNSLGHLTAPTFPTAALRPPRETSPPAEQPCWPMGGPVAAQVEALWLRYNDGE